MNPQMQNYLITALLVAFVVYKIWKSIKIKKMIPGYLEQGAVIVDVRTESEFRSGSNPKSINIPLNELAQKLGKLDKTKPIILCCASGARSRMAASILKQNGFKDVINAGSWRNT